MDLVTWIQIGMGVMGIAGIPYMVWLHAGAQKAYHHEKIIEATKAESRLDVDSLRTLIYKEAEENAATEAILKQIQSELKDMRESIEFIRRNIKQ